MKNPINNTKPFIRFVRDERKAKKERIQELLISLRKPNTPDLDALLLPLIKAVGKLP